MPTVTVTDAATVSYGQQLITLEPGQTVHGDLAVFLLQTSGVAVTEVDEPAPAEEVKPPRPRRGRPPKAS